MQKKNGNDRNTANAVKLTPIPVAVHSVPPNNDSIPGPLSEMLQTARGAGEAKNGGVEAGGRRRVGSFREFLHLEEFLEERRSPRMVSRRGGARSNFWLTEAAA